MSAQVAESGVLSRRDKIEAELAGCVKDHEGIRAMLQRIDKQSPGLMSVTGEIRNLLLDLGQRYHRLRLEMTVSVMVGDGEFESPSAGRGQRPVNELPMFVGLSEGGDRVDLVDRIDESEATRARFIESLHHVADYTLDADGEEAA